MERHIKYKMKKFTVKNVMTDMLLQNVTSARKVLG